MKKKICVITGSRAEYGLLKPLIDKIKNEDIFKLQLIATGSHLSSDFGATYKFIEQDGLCINEKIEILLNSDTKVGISKSMGLALISFGEALDRLKPDLIVVLGDRYEIFSAVSSAYVLNIPIAHIHGGETTEGAIDEGFRHSITKMSYLHFTSTDEYRQRVIQLGENPERVFNVGAIGIDNIKNLKLLNRIELEKNLNIKFKDKNIIITFHPVTLGRNNVQDQFNNLLDALDEIDQTLFIFTKSNADAGGKIINEMIDEYAEINTDKTAVFSSMGQLNYLSCLQFVDCVVGNSSSGIIEVPDFKIGTVNLGDRQKGRIKAESIVDCEPEKDKILKSIKKVTSNDFKEFCKSVVNPYGNGNTAEKIIKILKKMELNNISIKKFYDLK